MTHNKDKGTSVGFSTSKYEHEMEVEDFRKNTAFAKSCVHEYDNCMKCKFCGVKMTDDEIIEEQRKILGNPNWKKKSTEFHIEENLSVINKQGWEDILKEYEKFNNEYPHLLHYTSFLNWLKENYLAPEKK